MRSIDVVAGIRIRQLPPAERDRFFAKGYAVVDLEPYRAVVREMEGGIAYAIGLNGATARSFKVRLNKAAKGLDLKLRWAKVPKDAAEVVVELTS